MGEYEFASFGAGCFWGVQATFDQVEGVIESAVGYMGGKTKNPTYQQVCTGMTGHYETVQLKFDPKVVMYKELLLVFWNAHDPTQVGRQGVNIGKEYGSVIFYHSEKQKKEAIASMKAYQKKIKKPITTKIVKAGSFYRAEEYHQKFAEKHGFNVC